MKKFHFTKISIALFFVVLFSTCKKENLCDCIKRTGTIVTETRAITGFDSIVALDNMNVFIMQDPNFEVKVEAGKNIVPLITTEVVNGTLTISNNNRCNWTRSYDKPFNVYIKMPVVHCVTSNGTGNVKSLNTITTNELSIWIKNSGNIELIVNNSKVTTQIFGAGDVTLQGATTNHYCDIGGTAFLNCKDLQTNYTWVHTFTTGLCYVTTTNLACRIDYIGDLYCYGNPVTVQKTIDNTGQLYLK